MLQLLPRGGTIEESAFPVLAERGGLMVLRIVRFSGGIPTWQIHFSYCRKGECLYIIVVAPLSLAVVGLGRVGLPMVAVFAKYFDGEVLGVDVDVEWVETLRSGRVKIVEERLFENLSAYRHKIRFVTLSEVDFSRVGHVVVAIGVGINSGFCGERLRTI